MFKKSKLYFSGDKGPLRFFLIAGAVFGLLFLFITPPLQGADETVHFLRAYQVSEGHFASDHAGKKVGGELPVSIGKVVATVNSPSISFYPQYKFDEHKTKAALMIKNNVHDEQFYDFASSAAYSPAPYAGASSGILVSRVLHLPTLAALYAGRLGNLIAWLILVGMAIAYMPRRKWAFVAIGLLPMAVFQAATLNGDAVTSGSLLLLLALVLNFRSRSGPLRPKQLLALLLVAIVMVLSKQVMFIFLPLLLLLRNKNFKTPQQARLFKATLVFIPLLFFLGWALGPGGIEDAASTYAHHPDPSAQLTFILHSPHSYINDLWNTYFYTWGDSVTRSFIGTFGWSDAPLSELITTIGYIGLAALFIATYENKKQEFLDKKEKWGVGALLFLYWLAVSTSLYLYYSPVGYKIVYGLQGRYFIPLAILSVLLLQSKAVRITPVLYKRIAVFLPLFLLVTSTITLYVRYFINNV